MLGLLRAPRGRLPSPSEREALLRWLATQELPAGAALELPLPPELAHFSWHRTVRAARGRDGRVVALLERRARAKGNFTGTLLSDQPLGIAAGAAPRSLVAVEELPPFDELYLGRLYDERCAEVYFDLA